MNINKPITLWIVGWMGLRTAAAGDALAIKVLPKRVYPSIIYTLRLEAKDLELSKRYWSWTASGGEMLSDGEREVYWKSPSGRGQVRLAARAREAGSEAALEAQLEVEVEPPSLEGMVFIPTGGFTMGDRWTDTADPNFVPTEQNMSDKPAHSVRLEAFWIDRNKTTNRQYAGFLNDACAQGLIRINSEAAVGWHEGVEVPFYFFKVFPPRNRDGRRPRVIQAIYWDGREFRTREGMEEHPVMDVTWAGSRAFALHYGKRLPTEAEWEKAGRGPDRRKFPWGDTLPSKFHANINAYHGLDYVPVGSFSPIGDSPYGVADILGGFEWVNDWFDGNYYKENYHRLPFENPTGPEWGRDHTVRGIAVFTAVTGDVTGFQEPLTFRYQWVFEFKQGHLFAHGETGFRTALPQLIRPQPPQRQPPPPQLPVGDSRGSGKNP
ncbi:MAG: SUMF1/EgtB/PvdO family nonheme iron enzyme [Planctomycetes bacterium]|nr:SUMF1/EgtB/PvdO family nonheme iron enzyme [Planctomycetota bacterium]